MGPIDETLLYKLSPYKFEFQIIYKKENEGRQNPTNINKIRNEIQKLRSLRDIILGVFRILRFFSFR